MARRQIERKHRDRPRVAEDNQHHTTRTLEELRREYGRKGKKEREYQITKQGHEQDRRTRAQRVKAWRTCVLVPCPRTQETPTKEEQVERREKKKEERKKERKKKTKEGAPNKSSWESNKSWRHTTRGFDALDVRAALPGCGLKKNERLEKVREGVN